MKFEIDKCPTCGQAPAGIQESLYGLALLTHPDNHEGEFEYAGETEVNWDSQEPLRDEQGRLSLFCAEGHAWQSAVTDYDDIPPAEECGAGDIPTSQDEGWTR